MKLINLLWGLNTRSCSWFTNHHGARSNYLLCGCRSGRRTGWTGGKSWLLEQVPTGPSTLVDEFAEDYIYPMVRGNAVYEGQYLLGTSIARPLIARLKLKSPANSRLTDGPGATGKEMTSAALN